MSRIVTFVLSALVVLTHAGCACGTPATIHAALPSMDIPPPITFVATQTPPQFVAQSYAQVMQVPMQTQYAACPTYQAPAGACAPQAPAAYTPAFQYAQPPQAPAPRAAGDCR